VFVDTDVTKLSDVEAAVGTRRSSAGLRQEEASEGRTTKRLGTKRCHTLMTPGDHDAVGLLIAATTPPGRGRTKREEEAVLKKRKIALWAVRSPRVRRLAVRSLRSPRLRGLLRAGVKRDVHRR
jgi:hypothetical protein